MTMSLSELRLLRKLVGRYSVDNLKDSGYSKAEIETFEEVYKALTDFFQKNALAQT